MLNLNYIVLLILAYKVLLVVTVDIESCHYEIVESMPESMVFEKPIKFKPTLTHEALISLLDSANSSVQIASFYWTMTAETEFQSHPSTEPGKRIMAAIKSAVERGVKLQVVLDGSSNKSMNNPDDVKILASQGELRFVNMRKLLKSGVLHTKLMIVDENAFYLGSSNFDWRSYTQIKEIGIKMTGCDLVAKDLGKIFHTYWFMANQNKVPDILPDDFKTNYNLDNPIDFRFDDLVTRLFLSGSPPAFNGVKDWTGRTDDIVGLLHIIDSAQHKVDISVMNYSPSTEFIWPKKFWPKIDNALRKAAVERNVRVRLLFSDWQHKKDEELIWYRSLDAVQTKNMKGSIQVRMFRVPTYDDFQKKIPYARVKHDKYMVTDNGLYIGTSNWSPDYFINTCGISMVIKPMSEDSSIKGSVIEDMQDLFERDFNSEFSSHLKTSTLCPGPSL